MIQNKEDLKRYLSVEGKKYKKVVFPLAYFDDRATGIVSTCLLLKKGRVCNEYGENIQDMVFVPIT